MSTVRRQTWYGGMQSLFAWHPTQYPSAVLHTGVKGVIVVLVQSTFVVHMGTQKPAAPHAGEPGTLMQSLFVVQSTTQKVMP